MGMDLYGKNPRSKTGEYFRNNVWYWRPLWDFCLSRYRVANKVKDGHLNQGDGLNDVDARELAKLIEEDLMSGSVKKFKNERIKLLKKLPLETCEICKGTGKRDDEYVKGECNGCKGKGERKSFLLNYGFSVANVKEFQKFLRECGGFEIC